MPTTVRSILAMSVLLVTLTVLPPASTFSAPPARPGNSQVKDLAQQYYVLWGTLDPNKAAVLYAKDPDLVFYDIAPMEYIGWDQFRAGVQSNFFDKVITCELRPDSEITVRQQGNLAWTTETFLFNAKFKDGNETHVKGRHTLIWEHRNGKWLIVHEHASIPMPS